MGRVGVSNGQIVRLNQMSPGLYHGFVVEYSTLPNPMKTALYQAGLVDLKGKIFTMRTLLKLNLSNAEYFEFLMYEQDAIQRESYLKIHYVKNDITRILLEDMIEEGVGTLKRALIRALEYAAQLPVDLVEKGVGYWFNQYCTKRGDDLPINLLKYSLWGTVSEIGNETWMYNIGEKIIIEISPTYKWHFGEVDTNAKEYITLNDFMRVYKPIDILIISKDVAKAWLQKCSEIEELYN